MQRGPLGWQAIEGSRLSAAPSVPLRHVPSQSLTSPGGRDTVPEVRLEEQCERELEQERSCCGSRRRGKQRAGTRAAETLRQKDRTGTALWKVAAAAPRGACRSPKGQSPGMRRKSAGNRGGRRPGAISQAHDRGERERDRSLFLSGEPHYSCESHYPCEGRLHADKAA